MGGKPPWAHHQWFEVLCKSGLSERLVGKYKTREKAEAVMEDVRATNIEAWVVEVNSLLHSDGASTK